MKGDPRRLALLARLARLRAIERHSALSELGDAQTEHARLRGLHERSELLVGDYGRRSEAANAGDLHALFVVRSHLAEVARTASRMSAEAGLSHERAAGRFGAADRRHELVEQRKTIEAARLAAQVTAQAASDSGRLARRLQRPVPAAERRIDWSPR